jgi:protein-tyrosine phosphatase
MKKKKKVARVAILHCKAGKGRSGTVACSYLIAERGWSVEGALKRFTERRMRPGWGDGVSIKSQRRWIGYVARWATTRQYVESKVEIVEVKVWGMRDGVSLLIRCFVDDGRKIKVAHTWGETEGKRATEDLTDSDKGSSRSDASKSASKIDSDSSGPPTPDAPKSGASTPRSNINLNAAASILISNPSPPTLTILKPTQPIILPTQDVNFEVERRNKSNYGFPSVITSTAHCWFNTWFEGQDASTNGPPAKDGIFEIEWDAMDGLKGSSRRGVRAVDKVAIVWRTVEDKEAIPTTVDVKDETKTHGDEPEGMVNEVEESGLGSTIAAADTEGESDTEEGVQSYGVDEKTP